MIFPISLYDVLPENIDVILLFMKLLQSCYICVSQNYINLLLEADQELLKEIPVRILVIISQ